MVHETFYKPINNNTQKMKGKEYKKAIHQRRNANDRQLCEIIILGLILDKKIQVIEQISFLEAWC
jgi:hypothetical protein